MFSSTANLQVKHRVRPFFYFYFLKNQRVRRNLPISRGQNSKSVTRLVSPLIEKFTSYYGVLNHFKLKLPIAGATVFTLIEGIPEDSLESSDFKFHCCSSAMSVASADNHRPSAALHVREILNSCSKVRAPAFLSSISGYCFVPVKTSEMAQLKKLLNISDSNRTKEKAGYNCSTESSFTFFNWSNGSSNFQGFILVY